MKNINKKEAVLIRELLNEELPAILKKYNLRFELGNAIYDGSSVKFNGFRLSTADADTQEMKALKEDIEFRDKYQETTLRIGLNYQLGKKTVHLIGFKPRSKKRPYIIEEIETGRQFLIAEDDAEKMFGKPNNPFRTGDGKLINQKASDDAVNNPL